jgi:hypothetical protein
VFQTSTTFFGSKVAACSSHLRYERKEKEQIFSILLVLFIFVLDLAGYFSFSQTNLLYFYLRKGYWINLKYKNPTGRTDTDI